LIATHRLRQRPGPTEPVSWSLQWCWQNNRAEGCDGNDGAEKAGKHKTSMLQDVKAGRAIEIDALVESVVELGRLAATPTPAIDAIYHAPSCSHTLAKPRW
jgi:Ketopantoate reductase PanE/ApbA C terminal